MKINFKSIYAIPHNEQQSPVRGNYTKFMNYTANMREGKIKYNSDNEVCYVQVSDDKDKTFENYASVFNIQYRKADKNNYNYKKAFGIVSEKQFNDTLISIAENIKSKPKTEAEEEMAFLINEISLETKHKIDDNGNTKNITLFDNNGENIYAEYTVESTEDKGSKLIEKIEYKPDKRCCVKRYDDDGKCCWMKEIFPTFNIEYYLDEDGKWTLSNQ